jgi:hypothetical protein
MIKTRRMIQDEKAHGWEGGLAPAWIEPHSTSGGKPPFRTLRFLSLSVLSEPFSFVSNYCDGSESLN